MAADVHTVPAVVRLAASAATKTPGQTRGPHSSRAAIAMPVGGQTGVALGCRNARWRPAFAAMKYTAATSAVSIVRWNGRESMREPGSAPRAGGVPAGAGSSDLGGETLMGDCRLSRRALFRPPAARSCGGVRSGSDRPGEPAVHADVLSRDIAGVLRQKKRHRAGDFPKARGA